MRRIYDAVIFDLDGTLLDTSPGIISSVKYALTAFGKKIPMDEKLMSFIGPPLAESFIRLEDVRDDEVSALVKCFREHYSEHDLLNAVPYEGIADCCKALRDKGICMAIATYKPQNFADKLAEHFGLGKYMGTICGADLAGVKSKADIIGEALGLINIKPGGNAVMVGDTAGDLKGAEKQGIDFIGVVYGFGFKQGMQLPFDTANDVYELMQLLSGGNSNENI